MLSDKHKSPKTDVKGEGRFWDPLKNLIGINKPKKLKGVEIKVKKLKKIKVGDTVDKRRRDQDQDDEPIDEHDEEEHEDENLIDYNEDDDGEYEDPDLDDDQTPEPPARNAPSDGQISIESPEITEQALYDGIKEDRLEREAGGNLDNKTIEELYGLFDENVSVEKIAEEMNTPLRVVAKYKRRYKHDGRSDTLVEDALLNRDIPEPNDYYNEHAPKTPQRHDRRPPNQYPQQNYGPPSTVRDPLLDFFIKDSHNRADRAQEQNTKLILAMINKQGGGRDDGFFGGVVGDMVKTKMVSQVFGIGPQQGGTSDWMQTLQLLASTGQLKAISGQAMGLFRDFLNKDNPDYDPYEEQEDLGDTDMEEMTQEDFVKQFRKRYEKLPKDVAEVSAEIIFDEMPEAPVQEKTKAMQKLLKGINDFRDGCFALNRFVLNKDEMTGKRKTPREAAIFIYKNASEYVKTLKKMDLNEWLRRAEPFRNTATVSKDLNFIERPDVRPFVEKFLHFIKHPELLRRPAGAPSPASTPQPPQPPPADTKPEEPNDAGDAEWEEEEDEP